MNPGNGLATFDGSGSWLNPPRTALAAPFVRWIVRHGLALPDDYVQVLLRCESAAEVRFLLPIVTLSDWTVYRDEGFTNGRISITVQEEIGPYRADAVFRAPELGQPLVVEVDGPSHDDAGAGLRDRARTGALNARGFTVRRVRAEVASEAGIALRRELVKEHLRGEPLPTRSKAVVRSRRAWPANPLAYNVSALPKSERHELLVSWLSSRNISVPRRMEEFLSACNEAAEVNFLLPFVQLEGAYSDGAQFLGIDPYWVLVGQEDAAGKMDVVLGRSCEDGIEAVVFDIEPPPFVSFDSWAAELKRRDWRRRGFSSVKVGAVRAAKEGRWWADRVAAGVRYGGGFSLSAYLS